MFYSFEDNTIHLKNFNGTQIVQSTNPQIQKLFTSQKEALDWAKDYLSIAGKNIFDIDVSYIIQGDKLTLTIIPSLPIAISDISLTLFNEHTKKYLTAVKTENVFVLETELKPGDYFIDIEDIELEDNWYMVLCDELKIKIEI